MKTPLLDGIRKEAIDWNTAGALGIGGIPGYIGKGQKERGVGAGTSALTGAGIGVGGGVLAQLLMNAFMKNRYPGIGSTSLSKHLPLAAGVGLAGGAISGLAGRLFGKEKP